MKIEKTKIEDLVIIEPDVFGDERGFFAEVYNADRYARSGISGDFVQDNLSCSSKGVLRGLHYQCAPYAQGKLVQVIVGAVLDVAVDIRPDSMTFGEWVSVELTGKNKKQFWIPSGFAHGFLALEDRTIFSYKCTNYYAPQSEAGLMWDDPDLGIDWQLGHYRITMPIVSVKDQHHPNFSALSS